MMLLNPEEEDLQAAMVRDVIGHGGTVITVSNKPENKYGATAHIQIDGIELLQLGAFRSSIWHR